MIKYLEIDTSLIESVLPHDEIKKEYIIKLKSGICVFTRSTKIGIFNLENLLSCNENPNSIPSDRIDFQQTDFSIDSGAYVN